MTAGESACTQPNLQAGFAGSSRAVPILRGAALRAHPGIVGSRPQRPPAPNPSPGGNPGCTHLPKQDLLLLQLELQETKS